MQSREPISRAGWLVPKSVDTDWFGYLSLHAYLCHHAIFLWAMDHPAFAKDCAVPLAVRYTRVKAYGLQAQYMTIKGKPGITISCLRKMHKDSRDRRHMCVISDGYYYLRFIAC